MLLKDNNYGQNKHINENEALSSFDSYNLSKQFILIHIFYSDSSLFRLLISKCTTSVYPITTSYNDSLYMLIFVWVLWSEKEEKIYLCLIPMCNIFQL